MELTPKQTIGLYGLLIIGTLFIPPVGALLMIIFYCHINGDISTVPDEE